jgi:tetratricopeptide (TPR) repeat protein
MKIRSNWVLRTLGLILLSTSVHAEVGEWCPEGQKAFTSGNLDSANRALSSCLYEPPEDPVSASKGYAMRGETYFARDDYEAAASDFALAVELWPGNAPAWRSKAMVHYRLGENLEAITAITRSLEIDSMSTESHFVHATILTKMERPLLAMDAYDLGFSFESRETVQKLQRALEAAGFRLGTIDGVYGARTREALKECIAASCVLSMK